MSRKKYFSSSSLWSSFLHLLYHLSSSSKYFFKNCFHVLTKFPFLQTKHSSFFFPYSACFPSPSRIASGSFPSSFHPFLKCSRYITWAEAYQALSRVILSPLVSCIQCSVNAPQKCICICVTGSHCWLILSSCSTITPCYFLAVIFRHSVFVHLTFAIAEFPEKKMSDALSKLVGAMEISLYHITYLYQHNCTVVTLHVVKSSHTDKI